MRAWGGVLTVALALFAGPVAAATLIGTVELYADGRPLRAEEASEVIVYFQPQQPPTLAPVADARVMTTRRKRFEPRVLAITVGSQVRFPNEDPILHNVFSTAPGNAFDVGLIDQGAGSVVRFDAPGYVRIYCNVHHGMVGHILVLATPYFAHPDAGGRFRLDGLPDGPGELVLWHDRARPWRRLLSPGQAPEPLAVRLQLAQRRVPPHMNKFGRPYGRGNNGGY